ncbi:VRR-NUC domain-containing protein [Brevibacterium sp. 91QC2O2]|uniref:VRR-NUC domain-containing protein n=1 Tax=Brevibacterium TaxID=1696 RepID=UPI00211C6FAA|nr:MULTISPECIES: VRR-NUC domain-containing protein [unclassified Brevibacterium]MCQ9367356.1 VRR-NUC domain-containing protein [Brevibacterium sp. 91QC2O2]MCQ9384631.1 VRR-NUC domain-containing protein [Brevibacterium sp. 68QC2CO]
MKAADYRALQARSWTEAQFQSQVVAMARSLGWMSYHTHDSRRSDPGFPDLCLVHPGRARVMWRELKTETGRLRPAQRDWLGALADAGQDAGVWRPSDLVSGRIGRELR